jgi:threonine dehydratase
VARTVGEAGGNVIETYHRRAFTNLPLQSAEVEFVVQTRGAEHMREILEELASGGQRAELVDIEPL